MQSMRERYDALWIRLTRRFPVRSVAHGVIGDINTEYANLVRAYREPQRAYHTLEHIEDCLLKLGAWRLRSGNTAPFDADAVEFALWYHDLVYDPMATDNEQRSAGLACDALKNEGIPKPFRLLVGNLIMATKTHDPDTASLEEKVLLDIDLSILGAGDTCFDLYERQIREEYRVVPDDRFTAGRRRILTVFDLKAPLYQTPFFRDWLEERAHQNLKRSIAALTAT